MYLSNNVEELVNALKSFQYLKENAIIIAAYPYAYKPTRLEKVLITVSQGGLNAENVSLDGTEYIGYYVIDVNLFVPMNMGSPCMNDTLGAVIAALAYSCPLSFDIGKISVDDEIECFTAKCSFKYNS